MFYGWGIPTDSTSMMLYLVAIVIMVVSIALQAGVTSTFNKYNKVLSRRGITGAQAAQMVLDKNGVGNCQIVCIDGQLTDHFDPRQNVIRLSKTVYESTSVAAIGVASHEAGHATQYAKGYVPIKMRAAVLPVAQLGSGMGWVLAILGLVFSFTPILYIGIALFSATTVFHLITLPVELNASRRAIRAIDETRALAPDEAVGAKKVLAMAAMTYVAALASSVVQLLRLLTMANNRRR